MFPFDDVIMMIVVVADSSDTDDFDCALQELLEETADVDLTPEMALRKRKQEKQVSRPNIARPQAGIRRERPKPVSDATTEYDPLDISPSHRNMIITKNNFTDSAEMRELMHQRSHKRDKRRGSKDEVKALMEESARTIPKAIKNRSSKPHMDRDIQSPSDMGVDTQRPEKIIKPDYSQFFSRAPSLPLPARKNKSRSTSLHSMEGLMKQRGANRSRQTETSKKNETPLPVAEPEIEHWEDPVDEFRVSMVSSPEMFQKEMYKSSNKARARPKPKDISIRDLDDSDIFWGLSLSYAPIRPSEAYMRL